jgi:hypothetical protein
MQPGNVCQYNLSSWCCFTKQSVLPDATIGLHTAKLTFCKEKELANCHFQLADDHLQVF